MALLLRTIEPFCFESDSKGPFRRAPGVNLLSERDISELLALKSESKNLDYKQSMNWRTATAEQKAALVKDALAMANTQDGGKIILGVRDSDFEPTGLTDEEFESFDTTRFADFLKKSRPGKRGCQK